MSIVERTDNIGFSNLMLTQRPEEFCYGVDAVILADFAAKSKPKTAIDLGTGTGVIPLILSHKTRAQKIVGLEVQKESYALACMNAVQNGLSDRLTFLRGDVSDSGIMPLLLELAGADNGVDMVCANPPYMIENSALTNKNSAKMTARHETTGTLADFIGAAARLLKDKGHFYMVHRPSRLVDIMCVSRQRGLEPKELRLVCPKKGAEPNILLVHCVKNAGAELKILPELYVHTESGDYTAEILEIYEKK